MAKRIMQNFPWMKSPFIVGAPMRIMSGPELAIAVSRAGGLGFIGPGAKPDDNITDLVTAKQLLNAIPFQPLTKSLPIGAGFHYGMATSNPRPELFKSIIHVRHGYLRLAMDSRNLMNGLLLYGKPTQTFIFGFKSEHYKRTLKLRKVHPHRMCLSFKALKQAVTAELMTAWA